MVEERILPWPEETSPASLSVTKAGQVTWITVPAFAERDPDYR